MPSDDLRALGEELAAFGRRIDELRAAQGLPAEQLRPAFEAALLELDQAVQRLWPLHETLARRQSGSGGEQGRREVQLLREVFQALPLPVVLLDRDTVVRRLNRGATELIGVRPGYATGRPLTGFIAPSHRAPFRSHVSAVARGGAPRGVVVEPATRSEELGELQFTLVTLRPPGEARNIVLAVVQTGGRLPAPRPTGTAHTPEPETGRNPGAPGPGADHEARREAIHLDLLDAMATTLLSSGAADAAATLRQAARVLHGEVADWVIGDLLDEAGTRRCVVLGPGGRAGEELAAAIQKQQPDDCPLVVSAFTTASAAVQLNPEDMEGFGRDAEGTAILTKAQVTSLVCLPLCSAAADPASGARPVRGVLTLFRAGAREPFAMAEVGVLDRISRHIALSLERSHWGNAGE